MPNRDRSAPARGAHSAPSPRTGSPGVGASAPAEAQTLLDTLQAVARELRLADHRGEAADRLPPAQLRALRELAARPAASLAELAGRTHTDPSSASVVVQRLVERGLVSRDQSEQDRRRTELRATAAGSALAARAPTDAVTRVAGALAPLSDRQAAALTRGLRALASGLRASHDDAD